MSFSRTPLIRSVALALCLAASAVVAVPADAHNEADFQIVAAPFECGTEWVAPFGAHHAHPWNLDFNRTDLNYGENRQHDLGQPLFAQGPGTIVRIASHVNAGTYVEIDYGDYTVVYVHLVHGSVADGLVVGDTLTTGQFFAQIGDTGNATGFAHLHIEYFDSRGFDDTTSWELKQAGQPQTEVTFNGVPVEYDGPIVSTNCVGDAAGTPDPADGDIGMLANVNTRLDHLVERLSASTEALDGSTTAASYVAENGLGTNVFGRIPGGDLANETILISTSYTSAYDCAGVTAPDLAECPGATEHAAATSLVLDLADALAAAETPPRRTIVFAFWDEYDLDGGAAADWLADPANTIDDDIVAVVDYGIQGSNPTLPLRRATTASRFDTTWPSLDARFAGYATPDLTAFTTALFQRGTATALAAGTAPTIAFTDLAGSCLGTTADTPNAVDADKLAAQTTEAIAFVSGLAAGDPIGDPAAADRRADAAVLLEIVARAGSVGDAYDALAALLAVPGEPVGAALDTAADQLLADLVTEPCTSHEAVAPFTDVHPGSYARVDIGLIHDLGITRGTTPTTYGPSEPVSRLQMAAFLSRLWRLFHPDAAPSIDMPFTDVSSGSYAYDDVRLLVELGITRGTTDTTYAPANDITRLEMAAFLGRLWRALHPDHNPGDVPPHPFSDVGAGSYARDDISLIAWLGITTGTTPTTYAPGDLVTREQMGAFLARFVRAATSEG